jgi:hypothetical protein
VVVNPTLVTIDPDAFPEGTDIRNSYTGVTLSVVGTDGAITSRPVLARSGSTPTTVPNVFGQPVDTTLPLQFGWHWDENTFGMLRADFDRPTDYVQIDLIYGDDTVSVLRAFDADGNQLVEVKEDGDGRTADAFDTAVISRTEADIAYIIAGGWAAEATVLDNLKFNLFPEPTPLNACDDWSDNTSASAARTGTFENTWLSWTSKADASCDNPFHLYCVEQE